VYQVSQPLQPSSLDSAFEDFKPPIQFSFEKRAVALTNKQACLVQRSEPFAQPNSGLRKIESHKRVSQLVQQRPIAPRQIRQDRLPARFEVAKTGNLAVKEQRFGTTSVRSLVGKQQYGDRSIWRFVKVLSGHGLACRFDGRRVFPFQGGSV